MHLEPKATHSDIDNHIDGPILAELQEIMEDDFGILIETYIEDGGNKISELKQALGSADASALRELSHSFKGASCNIGALPLSRLCETVEHLAKDGHVAEIEPLLPGIETEFSVVKDLLAASV